MGTLRDRARALMVMMRSARGGLGDMERAVGEESWVATVNQDERGFIELRFVAGCVVDAENLEVVVRRHLALADGAPHPLLVDIREMKSMSRAARARVSGEEVSAATSRLAVLVGGPISRMIGTFFLRVTGPPYPAKLFVHRDEAMVWLRESA